MKVFKKKNTYKNCEVKKERSVTADYSHMYKKATLIAGIATAVIVCVTYYFMCFAINPHASGFWGALIGYSILFLILRALAFFGLKTKAGYTFTDAEAQHVTETAKRQAMIPIVIILAVIVMSVAGSAIFHAGKYASIMTVEDSVFEEDLAETLSTDSIALMDTDSAKMLGDREIGSLSHVVSQYNVSPEYTQIDKSGSPLKVAALEYAGFFKWINNKKNGVPGYVTVNPVSMSADYQKDEKGMIYVPSAYLAQDLYRKLRFKYPTALLENIHFEIDEEGNPYYIASVYKKTIAMFGGTTVKGAVILDPTDGTSEYYDVANVPQWADDIFPGTLLCDQYNWYGKLKNGFINSVIGKKGCKRVTQYYMNGQDAESGDAIPANDYGYVAKDGDIWIYTGITSVNGDSSNIGFLMADERTGETHYYEIAGADEKSAMSAAEGEVQEKRYQASFPSLINVDGQPTYIMVMKDASGLVKLYAAVNVEQYNLVATATKQDECIKKYKILLGRGVDDADDVPSGAGQSGAGQQTGTAAQTGASTVQEPAAVEATDTAEVTIADIKYIDINGNTYIYLIGKDGKILRQRAADNEKLLLLKAGDTITAHYAGKELVSFETADEADSAVGE